MIKGSWPLVILSIVNCYHEDSLTTPDFYASKDKLPKKDKKVPEKFLINS